jgi:hypothetical protein
MSDVSTIATLAQSDVEFRTSGSSFRLLTIFTRICLGTTRANLRPIVVYDTCRYLAEPTPALSIYDVLAVGAYRLRQVLIRSVC